MNDSQRLAEWAAAQTQTIAAYVPADGRRVWLRKAGRRNAAWRYALLGILAKCLRLSVLTPVPNVGGKLGIATEAARLRELAAAGIAAPKLLAVQEDALLMSDVGGETLLHHIEQEAQAGRLASWQQGLAAVAAVHAQGQFLSQAFARNMVVAADGTIAFIDFEDNPATVLPPAACRARDWLCYLHSTALVLREGGLLADAVPVWRQYWSEMPQEVRQHIGQGLKPVAWMRGLRHARWGRDTLRLAALAELGESSRLHGHGEG